MDEQLLYDAFVVKYVRGWSSISDALKKLGIEELISQGHIFAGKYLYDLKEVDPLEVDNEIRRNYNKFYDRYCRETQDKASHCDSSVDGGPYFTDSNCGGP
jgi:hypothetical protein